jgi:hypothetical protein
MDTTKVKPIAQASQHTLLTVNQFAEKHPAFTVGALRWMIFNEKDNDLQQSGTVIRLGKRVLISEEKFFSWVDSKQEKGAA